VYCRAIACDFDGTGAINGHPAPELYAVLAAARGQGIVTVLVTVRVWEDVQRACEELSSFDAVIAENGTSIHLCGMVGPFKSVRRHQDHYLIQPEPDRGDEVARQPRVARPARCAMPFSARWHKDE